MACGCSGGKSSKLYNVEVTFKDGTRKVFGSKAEARIAIAASGGGGTMRAVLKSGNPTTK